MFVLLFGCCLSVCAFQCGFTSVDVCGFFIGYYLVLLVCLLLPGFWFGFGLFDVVLCGWLLVGGLVLLYQGFCLLWFVLVRGLWV